MTVQFKDLLGRGLTGKVRKQHKYVARGENKVVYYEIVGPESQIFFRYSWECEVCG